MAQCISPYYHKENGMSFPCGKCLYCLQRRASGWSFRLIQHMKKHPLASFVTLTYNSEHVPITRKGRMSLAIPEIKTNRNGNKTKTDEIQKFFKRLRIIQERQLKAQAEKGYISKYYGKKIEYYFAGEYGSLYSRPHYHIILFNADPTNVIKAWTNNGKQIGTLFFGTVTQQSIGYTLKYISKESKVPQYVGDDRQPEFQRMSKGIGECYLTKEMQNWHLNDLFGRYYCNLPKSDIKIAIPRYYRERIYTSLERTMIGEAFQSKDTEEQNSMLPEHFYSLRRNDYQQFEKLRVELYEAKKRINNLLTTNDKIM